MSSIEKSLRDAGGQCVGGDLILKHEVVGQYRNGEFVATLAGLVLVEQFAKAKQEEISAIARSALNSSDPEIGDVSGLDMESPRRRRRGGNSE